MTDRPRSRAAVVAAVSLAVLAAWAPSAAGASGAGERTAAATTPGAVKRPPPNANAADVGRLDRTVRFLQNEQNLDGGFGAKPGAASDPLFSAWVALALAAAGVNPQDQVAEPGAPSVYTYLQSHAKALDVTTDYERVLMVAVTAGASPKNFGGVNLVRQIVRRQLADGSFPHAEGGRTGGINDTAFAVIGLSAVDDPSLEPVLKKAVRWLRGVQRKDGSWGWGLRAESSSDVTASVIEALRAAGVGKTAEERKGWKYIRGTHLLVDGGFVYSPPGRESNTASTAWVVQGMWAAGLEPHTYVKSGPSPLDYLASLQDPATGMVRWKASTLHDPRHADNPIWMTAYAAPAFAGYPLPIPAMPRAKPTTATGEDGVTSGGGGEGAPNFSRPEAGSQGETAGGVRRVEPEDDASTERQESTKRATGEVDEEERPTAASNGTGDAGVTRDAVPSATDTTDAGAAGQLNDAATTPPPDQGVGAAPTPQVSGTVVGMPRAGADGTGDVVAAAPGLKAAEQDRASALAAGLAVLLVAGVLFGMNLERQRVAST